LPVAIGTVAGAKRTGSFDGAAFVLALASVVCVHAAVNVFNDVFDAKSGADRGNAGRIHPFTGGSRYIQNGVMSTDEMAMFAVVLFGVGGLLGAALFALKGAVVLVFGATGLALGILYSVPPVQLAGRGLGEIAVGIGFGVVPVMGSAWLQTDALPVQVLLLSLPLGCWIAAVLIANEVPDAAADAAAGKRTLVVRLGQDGVKALYIAVQAAAVVSLGVGVWLGWLPAWGLAVPAGLLAAAGMAAAGLNGKRASLVRAIKLTLAIHLAGGLWLCLLAAAA
jgi:1,4-dihydroxy-2-naphthoate octaprenyltransferase